MDKASLDASLQATNASDMRDKELLQWLRAAEDWLPHYIQHIDICLHFVRILCSFPWGRFSSSTEAAASGMSNSRKTVTKIVMSFERLCCLLVSRSQQLMIPTLEAALRPFSVVGVRNAIPIDSMTRIINHCATTYPNAIQQQLFSQALDPLCPPKRWGAGFHHECFMTMLLNLALDAQLPTHCTLVGSFKELTVISMGGTLPVGGAAVTTPIGTPTLGSVGSTLLGGGLSSGTNRANDSSTDYGFQSKGDGTFPSHLSSENVSDAARVSGALGGGQSLQLSGHNRLMGHQVFIIGLVLQKLMEMELSIEFEDAAIEVVVDQRRQRKRRRKEGRARDVTAAASQQPSVLPSTPSVAAATVSASAAAEYFGYEHQDPNGMESPIHMLRHCVARVYHRLATEMKHRRLIGLCDRPSWWSELQAFHVECTCKIKNPIALHNLAPSLALLGVAGEGAELMHKVVSAVLKGVCDRRPSSLLSARSAVRVGMGRMIPPSQSDTLSPKQRVLASAHVFPLFACLTERGALQHDTMEGLLRRLFKYVVAEGGGEAKVGKGLPIGRSIAPHSLQKGVSSAGVAEGVVDAILGQALSMFQLLRKDGAKDLVDIPSEVVVLISDTHSFSSSVGDCQSSAVRTNGLVVGETPSCESLDAICSAYIQHGKVKPDLYSASSCPWVIERA